MKSLQHFFGFAGAEYEHQKGTRSWRTGQSILVDATRSVLILRFVEAFFGSLDHIRVELVAGVSMGVLETLEGLVIHQLKSSENLAVVVEERLDLIQVFSLLMVREVVEPEMFALNILDFMSIKGNMSLIEDGLLLVIRLSIDRRQNVGLVISLLEGIPDVLHRGVIALVLILSLRGYYRVDKIVTFEQQRIVELSCRLRGCLRIGRRVIPNQRPLW